MTGFKLFLLLTMFFMVGCNLTDTTAETPPISDTENNCCQWENGDPVTGENLFKESVLAGKGGCITCHSLAPNMTLVGPSLSGVATIAETRQVGLSATDYLYQSIMMPDDYLVEGFSPQMMPSNYATDLTNQEKTDLVAFLLTLQE